MEKTKITKHIRDTFSSKHWFICFGTLLYFIRDHIFNITQDIDIAIIGEIGSLMKGIERSYGINKYISSDINNDILNFSYIYAGISIDVYQFIKKNGYYWHTYDHTISNTGGLRNEYLFKGIPCDRIDVDQKTIETIMCNPTYGRVIDRYGAWQHAPLNEPGQEMLLHLPYKYGTMIDDFYPDWIVRRNNFGTSKCTIQKVVNSCKNL